MDDEDCHYEIYNRLRLEYPSLIGNIKMYHIYNFVDPPERDNSFQGCVPKLAGIQHNVFFNIIR